ncbi:AMP-binding protein [Phenylobacterium sp. LjRoot225]|uniref:AMP-binding protein n=1 Tax=Phenylobacterium sp. LjRoot225 TaxID=3342285 RepID=UPI003ED067AA
MNGPGPASDMTIPGLLRDAARRYKARPSLVAADATISFERLDVEADRAARAFLATGLQPGERVAVWAPNAWEWVAAAVGAQRVGGVLVPLNTRLRGGEVADIVRRAQVRHLVSIGAFLGRYYPDMLRGELMPDLRRITVLGAAQAGDEDWERFLALGETVPDGEFADRVAAVRPTDVADIMFTSGTTGAPKGAVFDHRRSILGGAAWRDIAAMTDEDRYCVFGPFSHNASYKAGWVAGLLTGSTVYWPEAYDAVSILDLIARNRITVMAAPPTVWQDVHGHPNRQDWDISSLRFLSTGATTIPIELIRRLKRDFVGTIISTGYGMTECCGSATQTLPGDDVERIVHTVGRPIPGTEIRIARLDGSTAETGEVGEVLIRDAKLLIEYLDDPQATREAVDAEGWLHSGDMGVLDAEGYLKVTDRLKDMYIVGGFNVYPAEIERQMSALEGLHSCAVIGIPDERLGEVGQVFIVRSPGSNLTEAEVLAWSKTNLANYKIPRRVTFVDDLPTNATGKVLKFELRRMAEKLD